MYSVKSMKGLILAGMIGLGGLLAGCGGGGAGGGTGTNTPATPTTTASISGTAATGAAMAGARITVQDSNGNNVPVSPNTVGADGTFTLVVTSPENYTGPFILRADPDSTISGDEHYSLLLALDPANPANNRVNITPLTSLIVYEATKTNLGTVFGNKAYYSGLTQADLDQASKNVFEQLKDDSATLAAMSNTDFLRGTFSANSTGYDKALDELKLVRITFDGNTPQLKDGTGGDLTSDYIATTPLYPIGGVTVSAQATQQVGGGLSAVTATVLDNRSPAQAARGVVVTFNTTAGTMAGADGAALSTATTDANGQAVLYLKSPDLVGIPATVKASVGGMESQPSTVTFTPGAVNAAKTTLRANPEKAVYGRTTVISLEARDQYGNRVDSNQVTFSTSSATGGFATLAGGLATQVQQSTTNGDASVTYTASTSGTKDVITASFANNVTKPLDVNLEVDTVSDFTVVAASTSIQVGTTTLISATAKNASGQAVIGATVGFVSTAGTIAASSVTNSSGVATAVLTAGTSATNARVTATVSGGQAKGVDVLFTAGPPNSVSLTAATTSVQTGDTVTLTATVLDSGNNLVANEQVAFSFVGSPGSGGAIIAPITATTNANGQASVTYTAGAVAGTDALTARTSNNKTATTVNVSVSKPPVSSISVSAGSASQLADGSSLNQISATVTDTKGNRAKGVSITFNTTAGTMVNVSGTGTNTATTDDNGVARLYLKSPTSVGSANVTARSDNLVQGQASVSFLPGAPKTLSINASPTTVAPSGTTLLSIAVVDGSGNPVADGQSISLSTNSTTGSFPGALKTISQNTVGGYVVVVYTAGSSTGTETLTARATGATAATATITVSSSSPTVASIDLTGPGGTIPADGASTATLTATVKDGNGSPISGVTVDFAKDSTDLTLAAATGTTNASGIATTTLKSTKAGSFAARATASGFTKSTIVNFVAAAAASAGISAMPNAVKPGGTSTIVAYVQDANANPVANETVTFTFTAQGSGTPQLSFVTRQTDAAGYAYVTYTAGNGTGTDKVTVTTSTGKSPAAASQASIAVSHDATVVGNVAVSASRASMRTGETAVISATVTGPTGAPIANYTVNFSTSLGKFGASTTASATTDSNGVAQVVLTAETTVGPAQASASAGGFSGNATVIITSAAPNSVALSFAPTAVKPGGSATLYAYVIDAAGNPVVGETVTFALTKQGSGLPALSAGTATTNQNGIASVVYTAGAGTSEDEITATTTNAKTDAEAITPNNAAIVIGSVQLVAGTSTLQAGGATTTARARVLDINGNPVNGYVVNFSKSAGVIAATANTNADGYAQITYTSPDRTGTVTLIADAAGILGMVNIDIVAGVPDSNKFTILASPPTVGTGGGSTITAVVLDAKNNPVAGQVVTFAFKTNTSGGGITPLVSSPTSKDGIASVAYTAGSTPGVDELSATLVGGASDTVTVTVTGVSLKSLAIGTSRASVKSDGSDSALITVTALSSGNAVVPNVVISLSANGGQLDKASATTDADGKATFTFRASTVDKSNTKVDIEATATGAEKKSLPILIVGSTATLSTSISNLQVGGASATVTVTARDASGNPVYDAEVTLSPESGDPGQIGIAALTGRTDANGVFSTTVTGQAPGSVRLNAAVVGATATTTFEVAGAFNIASPSAATADLTVLPSTLPTATLPFTVNAPGLSKVRFATTVGQWASCLAVSCEVAVGVGGTATDTLTSTKVGIASIAVEGLDASNAVKGTDSRSVTISGNVPAQVVLNVSAANMQPSIGPTANTVSLVASVMDASGQPVNNAAVAFSIENPTGGGETVSPVLALTSQGQAKATFTSGSLPTGQSNTAVHIRASSVADPSKYATAQVTIGGTAASIAVGNPTTASRVTGNDAVYRVTMSLIVVDANGNPVPNKVVSLSAWPTHYIRRYIVDDGNGGVWRPLDTVGRTNCVPTWTGDAVPDTDADGDGITNNDYGYAFTYTANEDGNENSLLDGAETDANGDGQLTPPLAAAGNVPASVITDAYGVATFDLTYLKQYSAWVRVRVRASALVQGTEARSSIVFPLSYIREDADACLLDHSQFQ